MLILFIKGQEKLSWHIPINDWQINMRLVGTDPCLLKNNNNNKYMDIDTLKYQSALTSGAAS